MSTFRSAFRLAKAVLPRGTRSKHIRRHGARLYKPVRARRAGGGPDGVVTKKFCVLESRETCGNSLFTSGSETFELADMPQFSNYVALYEQFKIAKIVYKFRSCVPVNTGVNNTLGVQTIGMLHTLVDHNDSTVPSASVAGIQNMMNDTSYRGVKSSRDLTRVIYPKFLMNAGTQTAKSARGWLNCRDVAGVVNAVSHYGIKWILEGGIGTIIPNDYNIVYQPIITYYIQFKNPQ